MPYRICFEVEAEGFLQGFETAIDACFLIDIRKQKNSAHQFDVLISYFLRIFAPFGGLVISFNTGFYEKGTYYGQRKKIIVQYLRTW